jgi:hypothetical protein
MDDSITNLYITPGFHFYTEGPGDGIYWYKFESYNSLTCKFTCMFWSYKRREWRFSSEAVIRRKTILTDYLSAYNEHVITKDEAILRIID